VRFVAAAGRDIDTIGPWAKVARAAIEALQYQPPNELLWRWLAGEEGAALHVAAAALMPPRVHRAAVDATERAASDRLDSAVAQQQRSMTLFQCCRCKWVVPIDRLDAVKDAMCNKRTSHSFVSEPPHVFAQVQATDSPPT
jgi:hypothetical protein